MSDKPTVIKHFPGAMVDWHLRTYGVLPGMTVCPLRTCQQSQAETGKRRCEIDLPVCAAETAPTESGHQ